MAWARIALLCPWGTKLLCPRVCRRIAHAVHRSLALRFPFRNQVFGCCPLDRLSLQPILALSSIRRGCLDHRSLARFGYGISAVCASRQRMHICTLSTLPSHSPSLSHIFILFLTLFLSLLVEHISIIFITALLLSSDITQIRDQKKRESVYRTTAVAHAATPPPQKKC